MKPKLYFLVLCFSIGLNCCKSNLENPTDTSFFAKGADISWVTEMEDAGKKFYDTSGQQKDLFELLKQYGMNTVRLRVWVNPQNGWNSTQDVISKALRAKAAGMRIMIDFHYSDNWADPGKQIKPANWQALSFSVLKDSLIAHTKNVLESLKSIGIFPHWVQVGNETDDGLLWPDGKASLNMVKFCELIQAGYNAVKNIFPETKVIVHVSNGWNNNLFRWIFDGLRNNHVNYDVIGMSLYPSVSDWQNMNNQCLNNMMDMVNRYGKEVMIVEIGMAWDKPDACKAFISDLIAKTKSVLQNKGTGVLYWEPECYNWQGYQLGCFDLSGKPTGALNAFK